VGAVHVQRRTAMRVNAVASCRWCRSSDSTSRGKSSSRTGNSTTSSSRGSSPPESSLGRQRQQQRFRLPAPPARAHSSQPTSPELISFARELSAPGRAPWGGCRWCCPPPPHTTPPPSLWAGTPAVPGGSAKRPYEKAVHSTITRQHRSAGSQRCGGEARPVQKEAEEWKPGKRPCKPPSPGSTPSIGRAALPA